MCVRTIEFAASHRFASRTSADLASFPRTSTSILDTTRLLSRRSTCSTIFPNSPNNPKTSHSNAHPLSTTHALSRATVLLITRTDDNSFDRYRVLLHHVTRNLHILRLPGTHSSIALRQSSLRLPSTQPTSLSNCRSGAHRQLRLKPTPTNNHGIRCACSWRQNDFHGPSSRREVQDREEDRQRVVR